MRTETMKMPAKDGQSVSWALTSIAEFAAEGRLRSAWFAVHEHEAGEYRYTVEYDVHVTNENGETARLIFDPKAEVWDGGFPGLQKNAATSYQDRMAAELIKYVESDTGLDMARDREAFEARLRDETLYYRAFPQESRETMRRVGIVAKALRIIRTIRTVNEQIRSRRAAGADRDSIGGPSGIADSDSVGGPA